MRTSTLAFAALTLALAFRGAAQTYTVTDLGSDYAINGFQSKVLNDLGQVIGNELGPDGRAFIHSGGMWTEIGKLNAGAGSHGTVARGLNNSTLIVGQSDTGASLQADGFFRDGLGGAITALGLVTAGNANQDAVAYGCNDLGIIVGNVIDYGAGTRETFLFKPGTGVLSRTSDNLHSFAVNRFGDVLGSTVGLISEPMLNGAPLPASTAGFIPHAINNAGQILLSVDDTKPIKNAWGLIYDYNTGKTKPLGNLQPKAGGYTSFLDINDAGHVVGRGSDADLNPHAVLYTPADGLISLDALGLTVGGNPIHLTEAHGINNAGQIVCTGYTTDPAITHGFLLTPDTPTVLPLAAAYDGIASIAATDAGAIVVTVTKTGSFSVKLKSPEASYAFTGKLTNDAFNGNVTVKGVALTVALQADAAHRKITGTIADGTRTFDVTALRQVKLGIFKGALTALLQIPGGPGVGQPAGIGHGRMNVSKSGAIKISGLLGDTSKYTVTAKPHYDGTWTFYAPLYTKDPQPGGIAGLVAFDRTAPASDSAGTLTWRKPGSFTASVALQAAYFKAVKDTQHLRFTNTTAGAATFDFAGGEQSLAAHTLSVSNKNVVTVTDPGADELVVKLLKTGVMSGSFIHPATTKKTTFTGVVQQKLNRAGGVFMGQTTAGSVLLTPQ